MVLHAPGHGAGQIALWSPDRKFLISADVVRDGDFGALTTRIEGGIAPWLHQASLDRLAGLDITVI